jgi:methylmalonyl-CoA mutase
LLAGRPGDREAALRAAGVDTFIYAGCDMIEALGGLHSVLGVNPR